MKARAQTKTLQLHFDVENNIQSWHCADLGKLRQVLINLINNAIKFTHRGSIVLSIVVKDSYIDDRSNVTFSVTDTGCGIAKNKQDDVFKAFTQLDNLQSAAGTGLGLAICQRLVTAMHGSLSLDSEENRGSTFSFTIPLSYASEKSIIEQQQLFIPAKAVLKSFQVLIVEDNEINLEVACALMEKLGHNVTPAKDGVSALQLMQSNSFDLALLDINLPDIDGVMLSQQLKIIAKEKEKTLVTIAVSAHVFSEDVTKFISSGFDAFVAKPVQMKKIESCIAKVMFNTDELKTTDIEKYKGLIFDRDKSPIISPKVNHDLSKHSEFPIFDANIPNQDIEYLGNLKVKQLTQLFCQQVSSEYSDFSNLSAVALQQKLHKLKGAAIGIGLVRLYELCKQLEIISINTKLSEKHFVDD